MGPRQIVENLVKNHLEVDAVSDGTAIFGPDSPLDSLGLVSLISDIEQDVLDNYGKEIVIASEKAMSLIQSPFSTVGTLADFVETLVEET